MEKKQNNSIPRIMTFMRYALFAVLVVLIAYCLYKPQEPTEIVQVDNFKEQFHIGIQALENKCKEDGSSGKLVIVTNRVKGNYTGFNLKCIEDVL